MTDLKINDVQVFLTQPFSPAARLVIVKVLTSEPGLYGLGCATFTQRHRAVEAALEHHIGPFVIGKDPCNIGDLWQSMMLSGYWRNGPVLNNAVSGIDMALWDIKGKLAGMPCYELWGGKCRPAVTPYVHANGTTPEEVAEKARRFTEQGFRHIRCQLGGYAGLDGITVKKPAGAPEGAYFEPAEKLRRIPALFEHLRGELGEGVELLYDVHERLAPIHAVALARAVEPYRLFFLEDPLAPEDLDWLADIRRQCATPIAMGELFSNPREIIPVVSGRLIDFIRVHISQIGGITPALRLAHLCDAFGVRTAWHNPHDTSPVGAAACIHLDLALHNFGIQEWALRTDIEQEMFPGTPEVRDGMVRANDRPGLGIDLDEQFAAKYPCDDRDLGWTTARLPDGTISPP